LVSAIQSYLGSQVDPENATAPTLNDLKPYISKSSQGSAELADTLAKDGANNGSAHVITGNKLISTYTPKGGGKAKHWTYDWKENSSAKEQFSELLKAIDELEDTNFIFTKANVNSTSKCKFT